VSEPFIERLSRFHPDGSNLDRNALLYRAGQASARRNRLWPWAAALLAVSQLVVLGALWPRPARQVAALRSIPDFVDTSLPIRSPEPSELWVLSRQLLQSPTGDFAPPVSVEMTDADSPLRASALPGWVN
jgi:hypothetical protein